MRSFCLGLYPAMPGGLALAALGFERPFVEGYLMAVAFQMPVDQFCPGFTPRDSLLAQLLFGVTLFIAEALPLDHSVRYQDIRSIFVANTKPHAFSYLVWGTVTAIAYVAQYSEKAGAGSWATGVSAIFCLGIGIIALFRGEKNITRGDWIAFFSTFLAIPLWIATSDPLWSVLLVTSIDATAYYPTFRKSYAKPNEELAFKYVLTAIKYLLSLFAIEHFTVVTSVYQFVSLFMELGLITMLLWRRAVLSNVVVR